LLLHLFLPYLYIKTPEKYFEIKAFENGNSTGGFAIVA